MIASAYQIATPITPVRYGIGELEANGHERDDYCKRRSNHTEGASIRTFDIGEPSTKLDEGEALQEI
jgi:hypothetical protein